jgi:hypothetical protein
LSLLLASLNLRCRVHTFHLKVETLNLSSTGGAGDEN